MKAVSSISRRTMLAGAAAVVPAVAVPALALASSEADPIDAAIEGYERAYAFHEDCIDKATALELALADRAEAIADAAAPEGIPLRKAYEAAKAVVHKTREFKSPAFQSAQDAYCDSRHNRIRCQALWGELKNTPEHAEVLRLNSEGCDAHDKAGWAVAETIPTTLAGAIALLGWFEDCQLMGHCLEGWQREIVIDNAGTQRTETLIEVVMGSLGEFLQSLA